MRPPEAPGGADLELRGLTWRPVRRRAPVLRELDLLIPAGQRVLLTGPSGAGKSTVLRALAGLLLTADHGELGGSALMDGCPVGEAAERPGLLLQDPTAGIVAETVGRDVAFGLENAGLPRAEIWPRVRAALDTVGFPYAVERPTASLSGGERQRLALAGALVLGGRALLLDEPVSMLDPASSAMVHEAVRRVADATSLTVVMVEHRIEPWLDFADRLVVLGHDGSIIADGTPDAVLTRQRDVLATLGVWAPGLDAPDPVALASALVGPWREGPPLLVRAHAVALERSNRLGSNRVRTQALRGVDAELRSGRALAITGPSGAGKSSLVSVLAGLVAPTSGRVEAAAELATRHGRAPHRWRSRDLAERLGWVPQLPEHGMVARTVREEILVAARACARDGAAAGRRTDAILDGLGLSALADANPHHLSGGEQRRLMVAAALANGPFGLLLDEPTVGQDRLTWAAVVGALVAARSAGSGVAVATHDELAVEALGDDVVALADGAVVT